MKITGKIKMWEPKKGFGFIGNGNRKDIFVEGWDIVNSETPKPGTSVEFEIEATAKGLRARKVQIKKKRPQTTQQPPRFYGPMG